MCDETHVKLSDAYKVARDQIEFENNLIGQRTSWFLTFQGFLFTALFVAIGLFRKENDFGQTERQHLAVAVLLIGVLGITSSLACYGLISAAYDQIDKVKEWWNGQKSPENQYPPLTGKGRSERLGFSVDGTHFLLFIAGIWIIFMVIFVHAVLEPLC